MHGIGILFSELFMAPLFVKIRPYGYEIGICGFVRNYFRVGRFTCKIYIIVVFL